MKYMSVVLTVLIFISSVWAAGAKRSMKDGLTAGEELIITLTLDVNDASPPSGVIVREQIPSGWEVVNASPSGYFSSSQSILKWLFYGGEVRDRVINYILRVPEGASGKYAFSGDVLTLAGAVATGGMSTVSVEEPPGSGSGGQTPGSGGGAGGGEAGGGGAGGGDSGSGGAGGVLPAAASTMGSAGSAGGSEAGEKLSEPLSPGVNVLTSELVKRVVDYIGSHTFYRVPRVLAAPLLVAENATGVYPAPENPEVLQGLQVAELKEDVYEFAARNALERFTRAETVVVARGDLEVDAIAAIPYARAIGAPILLTEPGALPEPTEQALVKLRPERVVIVGGPVAVSPVVEARLRGLVPRVERVWGKDRYETSLKLALSTGSASVVVVADGRKVSTEVALIAESFSAPVVYVSGDVPPELLEYLKSEIDRDVSNSGLRIVLAYVDMRVVKQIEDVFEK